MIKINNNNNRWKSNETTSSMALTRSFFLGTLLMSILMSVRESLLKLTWDLTISGASTRA